MGTNVKCIVCNSDTELLFTDLIIGKYNVGYNYCSNCKCLFTEKPYWIDEAYEDSILRTDTGIMVRNLQISNEIMIILRKFHNSEINVVDYGGGYGILTRILRDRGVNAFWSDKFSVNLLVRGFEYGEELKADVFLAFEVVEHLVSPFEVIKEIMGKTDCFIFSTTVMPRLDFKSNKDWWYFAPEAGQHIFFSTKETFVRIAEMIGCRYVNIGGYHILFRGKLFRGLNLGTKFLILSSRVFDRLKTVIFQGRRFKSKTWSDHLYMKFLIEKGSDR